jgi:undecaprenyl-diphosphatase
MDETLRAAVLAFIQGLTEFLPISSSAHLILPSQLLGWPDQGLAFDVAVHLGSLVAVLLYFRQDLMTLLAGSVAALRTGRMNEQFFMVLCLALATLPVAVAGVLLADLVAGHLRTVPVIAATTIGFGVLLALADRRQSGAAQLSLRAALLIGLAQVLAIIPGTSRSGITMTAALFCGLNRQTAARFSFLLSIPVIAAAGAFTTLDALETPAAMSPGALILGTLIAAATAYATIAAFLKLVDRIGFLPFAVYRCLLGAVILAIWL